MAKQRNRSRTDSDTAGWLLIFYRVPARPVSRRMKIWRRLARVGAVPLKGAVYLLPYSEEHVELCQWFMSEITAMGGEGDFARVEQFGLLTREEIVRLFQESRESEYRAMDKRLFELETLLASMKKGGRPRDGGQVSESLKKLARDFEQARGVDFFTSDMGSEIQRRLKTLDVETRKWTGPDSGEPRGKKPRPISRKRITDYRGKVWVTRKKPFVDRMASAWLIKRFIDPGAVFEFRDESEIQGPGKGHVSFDVKGGEFTHAGELCTFEVLIRSFGLKERGLKKLSEIVHELDMQDSRFEHPETRGIGEVLRGIRKKATGDADALDKGTALVEMLYASRT